MFPISHLKMLNFNGQARTNVKKKGRGAQRLEEKKRGWILWMAAVKGRRRVIKARGVCVWQANRFWSVEELILEGRVSKWETMQQGAALS